MNADPVRRLQPGYLAVEPLRGADHPPGQDTIGEGVTGPINVGQEGFQGKHPLPDTSHDQVPFHGVHHPGDEVQRERPFLAGVVVGDPAVGEHPGQLIRPEAQLGWIQWLQGREQPRIGSPRPARLLEHLIPGLG